MITFSASSLQTLNFEFTNSKFQVYKLEISSLQTRNFEFSNSKFRVCKRSLGYKASILTRSKMADGVELPVEFELSEVNEVSLSF